MRDGREACPFCGGYAQTVKFSGKWGHFVSCRCTAVGPSRMTRQAAIGAWNERVEPKPDNQERLF